MKYKVTFVGKSLKQLNKLPKYEKLKFEGIIETLRINPYPPNALKLVNRPGYRIRFGDYRLIYEVIDDELVVLVLALGHRKEVFKK